MKKLIGSLALAGALAAFAIPAATAGSLQVAGVQTPVSPGVYTMSGDLEGDWYDTTPLDDFLAELRVHPSGTLQARGTELFVGCLADRPVCGTLTFEYHAEIRLAADFETLIRGRCWHEVTGGTGGFAGATGVINFKDDPVTGCSYYKGHISLP